MIKKLIPSVIFAFSLLTFQAAAEQKNDFNAKITHVYINSYDDLLIRIDSSSDWIRLGKVGEKRAEMMYSTALAAKVAGANVWVRYWDYSDDKYSDIRIVSVQG
ncbi:MULTISPECIES: hypothetical protein [Pseudoalteromonas]|uniref:Uncharacterized protein n=1 Tax=Pseudoalteromonas luteoviolacea (strain 2ta16) TaxID=1353533 RepID=V4HZI6_PSEL2|nr:MULTISPECIES: hypothetical protein [Pseudoalteromonas]ESP93349.1 hypothetical protein PL2TA16_03202 [Pseudoalteromonas luteoviolacea 2ta16]KZN33628.1 hypothetical protein N483_26285 [Pseudoalteromonas luteoviolacea NCIMB 1944]MCG7551088.1 hypothetical protein [Pseudoalteromonas sp. Of7M-16]